MQHYLVPNQNSAARVRLEISNHKFESPLLTRFKFMTDFITRIINRVENLKLELPLNTPGYY